MSFAIRMGIPEMFDLWNDLSKKKTAVYGPDRQDITIIGLEPHPEDKKNGAYDKVSLSDMPNIDE